MRNENGSSATARIGRILAAVAVALVFYGCAGMSGTQQGGTGEQDAKVWPKASSPQSYMAPNGDRTSNYPPYFHPSH